MTNLTDEELCVSESYTSNFKLFSLSCVILFSSLIVISLVLWFTFENKNYPTLVQRSKIHVFVLCISWSFNIFVGPFLRTDQNIVESVSCFQVWQWFLQVKFNKLSFKLFQKQSLEYYASLNKTSQKKSTPQRRPSLETEDTKQESGYQKDENELERLGKLIQKKNKLKIFSLVVLFSLALSAVQAVLLCTFGAGCTTLTTEAYFANNILISLYGIGGLCFSLYIHKVTKDRPDPYNFMYEIKISIAVPLLFGIFFTVIGYIYPTDDPSQIYRFAPGVLIDIGFASGFSIAIVLPLKVIFSRKMIESEEIITLKQLLESDTGLKVFRSYMIYELSIESLNFYLVATKWKEDFNQVGTTASKIMAKNIVSRWIDTESQTSFQYFATINIGYKTAEDIKEKMKDTLVEKELFDEAIKEVYQLMSSNSFPRFKRTMKYRQFVGSEIDYSLMDASL
eukprot:snap_masked-scaffold_53-processed-gene-0.29-mRNA-1 protein AED:1.00 eAED:1.00 QI:0/0/0/0/1/1/2/0/451